MEGGCHRGSTPEPARPPGDADHVLLLTRSVLTGSSSHAVHAWENSPLWRCGPQVPGVSPTAQEQAVHPVTDRQCRPGVWRHGAGSGQGSGEGGALQLRVTGAVALEDGCILASSLILVSSVASLACSCSVTQCPALCSPMGCSPPGSSVHGVLQARKLEWVAISSSMDLPDPGIKPMSLALADGFFTRAPPVEPVASVASFNLILPQFHPLENEGNCPQPPVWSGVGDLVLLVMIFICC